MPQYKNLITGNLATLSEEYAKASGGADSWEKIADEAPEEKEQREIAEAAEKAQEEARANKVELVVDEPDYTGAIDPVTGVPVDPKTGVAPEPETPRVIAPSSPAKASSKTVTGDSVASVADGRHADSSTADNQKGA